MRKPYVTFNSTECMKDGMMVGSVLAMILSFSTNHSILYCIIHGILSWVYVIYWYLTYGQ